MIKAVRALGLVKIGDVTTGITDMEEAIAWFERSKLRYTRSFVALWLAETCLRHGDHDRARTLVDDVLAISRAIGYRHLEGVATRLLGELLIETEPAAAAEHVASALVILGEVGARNDVAKTLVAQAALRRASGAARDARGILETALKVFDDQGTLDELAQARGTLAADPPDVR
jgi:tetratricopeptide (TPR) repeat protein